MREERERKERRKKRKRGKKGGREGEKVGRRERDVLCHLTQRDPGRLKV